ncbi:putative Peptidase S16, lon-like [Nitrospira sp. KM1]|uniref:LON peptidase substrate-binding domain-containing protein n=1 Tax=Nitrospira sp. KM1 TaxID=1936990 RepID=UPI0013A72818|nr:LON peptidase substrate-binding domain-containing protein [Nitrospira sp. KM1]BCA55667.1 putative Peptidase S16, lon-like [Nitrospira sp. KM1]
MQVDREREHQGPEDHDKSAPFPIPSRIPIFALPNVVLFPKTYLPLHIFEPRYRQMVDDAARTGQCIGMALLKEGWEPGYYGNPPIYGMGCVGRLVSVQPLADGRSNILLQGLQRFEVAEESYDKAYRQATITIKARMVDTTLDGSVRRQLIGFLERCLRSRDEARSWQSWFREDVTDEVLVNTLSSYLECTPLEKQFLLEADSLHQQACRLSDLIQFLMHDHHGTKGWG